MRWILTFYFLLASTMGVFSSNRPRRDLWSLKHLISSKLFGTETIVIQLPKISKNETSQLFKIKGYDNIFLKVTRKTDNVKPATQKPKDPVMVSPEIAIIGSYLGTTTEGDTLFALEIAKNLLKSGILSGERVVQIREPTKSDNVVTTERDPIYVVPALNSNKVIEVVNPEPMPIYQPGFPSMLVASEVKYRPIQTKYSYKQESENADMKFESYNNQDVIVTRTNKIPDKPRYITVRLAEVASIGANPCLITSKQCNPVITQEHALHPFSLKSVPILSHVSGNVPQSIKNVEALKQSDKAPSDDIDVEVPSFIQASNEPFDIRDHLSDAELEKLNKFINAKLNQNKKSTPNVNLNINNDGRVPYLTQNIENYKDFWAAKYGNLVHRYVYQQMGDVDQKPIVVAIEDPQLNDSVRSVNTSAGVPQDFVYVPPLDADAPPLPKGVPNANMYPEYDINDYGMLFAEEGPRGGLIPSNFNNQPAATNVKNTEPVRFASNSNDNTISTPTMAPPNTTKDTKNPTPSIFKRVNNVSQNLKPTTAKSSSYETTSKSTDNLAIIGLNASNEMYQTLQSNAKAVTLKTNIKNPVSPTKNPILVAGIDKNASSVRNYRPRLQTTSARPYTGGPVF